jgi:hypothetical protein
MEMMTTKMKETTEMSSTIEVLGLVLAGNTESA